MAELNWETLLNDEGAQGGDFVKPVPEDDVEAEITSVKFQSTKAGQPSYNVRFTILEGPQKGVGVFKTYVLEGKALGFFFGNMRIFGLGDDFFKSKPDHDDIINWLVGKTAKFNLVQNGEYVNIDKLSASSHGPNEKWTPESAAAAATEDLF